MIIVILSISIIIIIIIISVIVIIVIIIIIVRTASDHLVKKRDFRSKQRDPSPQDGSLMRKDTSTYKAYILHLQHCFLIQKFVRVRATLRATQDLVFPAVSSGRVPSRSLLGFVSQYRSSNLVFIGPTMSF